MSTTLQRATALQALIGEGRIAEAMREYYAPDVVMQENLLEPMRGLEENLAREEAWLATVAEFKSFEVLSLAATDEVSFAETSMSYVDTQGQEVHLTQVSRALWKDGRIVHERFYHG